MQDCRQIKICCVIIAVFLSANFTIVPNAYGLAESTGPEGSNSQAVNDPCGPNEIGSGIKVGILGGQNVYAGHGAFNGVTIQNYAAEGLTVSPDWHDTIMAGIIASQGQTSYPDDIGVAPGVEIHSMKIAYTALPPYTAIISEGLDTLVDLGCRVIVSGFDMSDLTVADGNSQLTLHYDYQAFGNNIVFVNPAGKATSSITETTVPGDAYNAITTGGLILNDPGNQYVYRRVGNESLSGYTVDGRKKPDVSAASGDQTVPTTWDGGATGTWTNTSGLGGQNGATSYSVPHTAGVAALLLGFADDSPDANDGQNEVITAVIVNSTFPNVDDKAGNSTNPADSNNTWHADRGYGRIDAFRAYELLSASEVVPDVNITAQKGWAYTEMLNNDQHSYFISVQKNHRLLLTVAWNREVTKGRFGNYSQESSPKFNLNLTIKDPCDLTLYSGTSAPDNLKKVDLLLPADGLYEIILENNSDKSRSYALAFEKLPPLTGDFQPDYVVDRLDLAVLAEQWLMEQPNLEANLAGDDAVDMADFAEFAGNWLKTDPAYYSQP